MRPRFPSTAALLLLLAPAGCRDKETALARVGDRRVVESDFRREAQGAPFAEGNYLSTTAGRRELLELLVRRLVVLAEAERSGLAARPEVREKLDRLDREFDRQKRQAPERLLVGDFLRRLKDSDLKVLDEEVRRAWETEKETRASHILLSDAAAAEDVLKRLRSGASFEALARELSEDPGTGARGGDLGYLLAGGLTPEFERALAALKVGETSGAVVSPYGFHIVRKTGERPLSGRPFDKAAADVRTVLEQRKFQSWLDQARARHKVSVDLAALQNVAVGDPTAAVARKSGQEMKP